MKCLPFPAGGTLLDVGELDALLETSTGLSQEQLRLQAEMLQAGVVHVLQLVYLMPALPGTDTIHFAVKVTATAELASRRRRLSSLTLVCDSSKGSIQSAKNSLLTKSRNTACSTTVSQVLTSSNPDCANISQILLYTK